MAHFFLCSERTTVPLEAELKERSHDNGTQHPSTTVQYRMIAFKCWMLFLVLVATDRIIVELALVNFATAAAVAASAEIISTNSTKQQQQLLSVKDFGAIGNGTVDDTDAIYRALNVASTRGGSSSNWIVYFPPGIYPVSQSIEVGGLSITGTAAPNGKQKTSSSVIKGTVKTNFRIITVTRQTKRRTIISNLKVTGSVQKRDYISVGIFVDHSSNYLITNVTIDTGTGGIQSWGSSNGLIVRNRISNVLADCIHTTGGSSQVIVSHNVAYNCGDDMFSVVSYLGEPITHNVLIQDNIGSGQVIGRGISVVGGQDITIQRNMISNTFVAGILVASEPSYNTHGTRNILIRNNTLRNVGNLDYGHSGLFVSMDNPGFPGRNILFDNNVVNDSRADGVRIEGVEQNVAFLHTAVNHANRTPYDFSTTSAGLSINIYCIGNTMDGSPTFPSHCIHHGKVNFSVNGSKLVYNG